MCSGGAPAVRELYNVVVSLLRVRCLCGGKPVVGDVDALATCCLMLFLSDVRVPDVEMGIPGCSCPRMR